MGFKTTHFTVLSVYYSFNSPLTSKQTCTHWSDVYFHQPFFFAGHPCFSGLSPHFSIRTIIEWPRNFCPPFTQGYTVLLNACQRTFSSDSAYWQPLRVARPYEAHISAQQGLQQPFEVDVKKILSRLVHLFFLAYKGKQKGWCLTV